MIEIVCFPFNLGILILLITFLINKALKMNHNGFPNGSSINFLLITIKQTISRWSLKQLNRGHGLGY